LRARAIESAAYVVASATIRGADGTDAFATYGHGLAVDPWGTVLADLGETAPAWRVLDLRMAEVHRVRSSLPVLAGVRPDAYAADPETISVG
jgi:predicted amidohydrolase